MPGSLACDDICMNFRSSKGLNANVHLEPQLSRCFLIYIQRMAMRQDSPIIGSKILHDVNGIARKSEYEFGRSPAEKHPQRLQMPTYLYCCLAAVPAVHACIA